MEFKIGDQFLRAIAPHEVYISIDEWIWLLGEVTDVYTGKNFIDVKFKTLMSSDPSLVDPKGGFTDKTEDYRKARPANRRSKIHLIKILFLKG